MTVVVISPHPDDNAIAMGGTIAKYVSVGHRVSVVYVTNGARSPIDFSMSDEEMAKTRRKEARNAAIKILGVTKIYFLESARAIHEELNKAKISLIRKKLKRIILQEQPKEIYVPHLKESHKTHRFTAELLLDLLQSIENLSPRVWGYEVWTPIEDPSIFIDITCFVDIKRKAIEEHKTQLQFKRYGEGILGLNTYRAVFLDAYQPGICKICRGVHQAAIADNQCNIVSCVRYGIDEAKPKQTRSPTISKGR